MELAGLEPATSWVRCGATHEFIRRCSGDSDGEDDAATDEKLLERQRTEMSNDGQLISSVR
jgi:hypothetical protein